MALKLGQFREPGHLLFPYRFAQGLHLVTCESLKWDDMENHNGTMAYMPEDTHSGDSSSGSGFSLNLLSKSNPVFGCYMFWTSLLIVKMLLMSLLTARQRMKTQTYANPEDLKLSRTTEVKFGNESVERVRR